MNIQDIKNSLTVDEITRIIGVEPKFYSERQIIYPSICHHFADYAEHKPKLYYYTESKSFYCYVCGFSGDIFSLVEKIRNITFKKALAYICGVLGISETDIEDKPKDEWQRIKRFLPKFKEQETPLKVYDEKILDLFDRKYYQEWLDYGITKATMDLYKIGFYERTCQITIPVYQDGKLIGIRGRYIRDRDTINGKYKPIITLDGTIYSFPSSKVFYGYDHNKKAVVEQKSVILVEGEKTVLKFKEWGIENAFAVFGSNISKDHIDRLLQLGVTKVVLGFDSDYHIKGDEDYKKFVAKISKIIKRLRAYFAVEVLYNNIGAEAYKYSPTDYSYEDFKKIYKEREIC